MGEVKKMNSDDSYWEECVSEALDGVAIFATNWQISYIAEFIKGAHENYGMAFGHECIPNPLRQENENLKKVLKDEKEKIICEVCDGKGIIITEGCTFVSRSECWRCRGEGRYKP